MGPALHPNLGNATTKSNREVPVSPDRSACDPTGHPGADRPGPGAVLLAAGSGRRSGTPNKLLVADAAGCPMVVRAARLVAGAFPADRRLLVTGHDAARVRDAVAAAVPGFPSAHAHDHADGLSAALRRGIAHADRAGWPAVLVFLGDMPLVAPATVAVLLSAFAGSGPAPPDAAFPVRNGRRGHPVLWRRSLFRQLSALAGDAGGRVLFGDPALRLLAVPVDDPGAFADFDTPDRLAVFRGTGQDPPAASGPS